MVHDGQPDLLLPSLDGRDPHWPDASPLPLRQREPDGGALPIIARLERLHMEGPVRGLVPEHTDIQHIALHPPRLCVGRRHIAAVRTASVPQKLPTFNRTIQLNPRKASVGSAVRWMSLV